MCERFMISKTNHNYLIVSINQINDSEKEMVVEKCLTASCLKRLDIFLGHNVLHSNNTVQSKMSVTIEERSVLL